MSSMNCLNKGYHRRNYADGSGQWIADGFISWNDSLREELRQANRREADPSAAIIDSQSVKTTEVADERGYDAGKKINGRKRHALVDTIGLAICFKVLAANIQDRDGAKVLLEEIKDRIRTRSKAFTSCHVVGWSKDPSPGFAATGD